MTNPPLISIITVCFNSAHTLAQTLQSVAEQDYPAIEHIIVDGGSTDGSLAIIEAFRDKISSVISEPDKGIYDAMNKGIQRAKGEVVGLLNADDLYAHPQALSNVMEAFRDESIEACYGDLVYFSEHNPEKIFRYWRSCPFQAGLFAKGWCPPHPTFFVRRQVYARYGGFVLQYPMGNDVELMMRFLEKYKIQTLYVPQVLVKMRLGGVSNRQLKNIWLQNKAILQAARDLNVPISPIHFFMSKGLNRLWQVITALWLSTRKNRLLKLGKCDYAN